MKNSKKKSKRSGAKAAAKREIKRVKKPVKASSKSSKPSARKGSKRPGPVASKKPFILAQPMAMPVKEVVALAKKQGMRLSENYVQVVRTAEKIRIGSKEQPEVRAPRRKAGKGFGAKKAFVLSLPLDMPAKEVLAKAKEAGMKISYNYVSLVRTGSNGVRCPATRPIRVENGSSHQEATTEKQLQQLIVQIGLARSRVLMDEVMTLADKL